MHKGCFCDAGCGSSQPVSLATHDDPFLHLASCFVFFGFLLLAHFDHICGGPFGYTLSTDLLSTDVLSIEVLSNDVLSNSAARDNVKD